MLSCEQEATGPFAVVLKISPSIEGSGDFGEVHAADFKQGDDESGDEVESAWVEVEMAFQSVLDWFMLHLATSPCRDLVAFIMLFCVGDGKSRLLSGS